MNALKTFLVRIVSRLRKLFFPPPPKRVTWRLCVAVLDGPDIDGRKTRSLDIKEIAEAPIAEAVEFIEANSRFKVTTTTVVETKRSNTYFSYPNDSGQLVYNMLRDQIPSELWDELPVADTYVFLFKMNGRLPALGGSTMGVADGKIKGGVSRPYSTIPCDVPQYGPQPYEGFTTQRAQIDAHEIINAINCVTAIAPYFCTPMRNDNPNNLPSAKYEARRLQTLTDKDYKILLTQRL